MAKHAQLLVMAVFLLMPGWASAQASKFAGDWVNVDPNTTGIVSLHIVVGSDKITVEGEGKCHPVNCRIPLREATAYATRDGEDEVLGVLAGGVPKPNAKWYTEIQVLRVESTADGKRLKVESLRRFDDGSGRGPWYFSWYFKPVAR